MRPGTMLQLLPSQRRTSCAPVTQTSFGPLPQTPLRLRRVVPRRGRQHLYDLLLRRYRPPTDPRAEAITVDDFELYERDLEQALDLYAFCRAPRG